MKDFFNKVKVKIVELYQKQKAKKKERKELEDRIFAEELAKIKIETEKTDVEEIRVRAEKAAKMTNKGVPSALSKGIVTGISELEKGRESVGRITKDLEKVNTGKSRKSLWGVESGGVESGGVESGGRGLDSLISIDRRKPKSKKKKKEAYPWSLE